MGWKRPGGLRRFRELFLYVPKKNGKSVLIAALLIYILTQDHEHAAEMFVAASNQEQTKCVFDHIKLMIRANPRLNEMLGIFGERGGAIRKSISYDAESSSIICIPSDEGSADGPSVHVGAIDEVHRHPADSGLADILKKGSRARPQPLLLYTTTADYNRESVCNTLRQKAIYVRDNPGDPAREGYFSDFLPVIYEADLQTDDWEHRDTWYKANPNMGVTVQEEDFAAEVREAKELPATLNSFLRLRLNIITDADVAWIPMHLWDECVGDVDEEELAGQSCYAGLDLASKNDITGFVMSFPQEDGHVKLLARYWVPEALTKPKGHLNWNLYSQWVQSGHLRATPDLMTDYGYVRRQIIDDGKTFKIEGIGVDPLFQAAQLSQELIEYGFEVTEFNQTMKAFAAPTLEFQTHFQAGTLEHGGNPVTRWMAGNTMVKTDESGNMRPDKKRSSGKIDGIVCGIMAVGLEMVSEPTGIPTIMVQW